MNGLFWFKNIPGPNRGENDAGKIVDNKILRSLVPANALNAENFQELASKARLEEIPAGRFLFKKGEMDRKTVYVLTGEFPIQSFRHRAASTYTAWR